MLNYQKQVLSWQYGNMPRDESRERVGLRFQIPFLQRWPGSGTPFGVRAESNGEREEGGASSGR